MAQPAPPNSRQSLSHNSRHALRFVAPRLGRLYAGVAEVGLDPTDLVLGDLAQFREWLRESCSAGGGVVGVAEAFIALRHSREGRAVLGKPEPPPRPLRINLAPLRPRFDLRLLEPDEFGRQQQRSRYRLASRTLVPSPHEVGFVRGAPRTSVTKTSTP